MSEMTEARLREIEAYVATGDGAVGFPTVRLLVQCIRWNMRHHQEHHDREAGEPGRIDAACHAVAKASEERVRAVVAERDSWKARAERAETQAERWQVAAVLAFGEDAAAPDDFLALARRLAPCSARCPLARHRRRKRAGGVPAVPVSGGAGGAGAVGARAARPRQCYPRRLRCSR